VQAKKGLAEAGYVVGRMGQPEFFDWLRKNLLEGTALVFVDPEPGQGTAVEIFGFLAEIEGGA
jgi:hypothetical protein